jgi:gliding motility-associated-like protein
MFISDVHFLLRFYPVKPFYSFSIKTFCKLGFGLLKNCLSIIHTHLEHMRKNLLFLVILSLFSTASFAQDFSNKGKEFYLCFPHHVPSGAVLARLSIWITSDQASSGTITMANGSFSSTFNIAANGLAEISIPQTALINNTESSDGTTIQILKKSIKVKVDPGSPAVVAYVQQYGAARSAASLLLPSNVLGKKYYAVSYTQQSTGNVTIGSSSYISRSQFQIIATQNNTVVTITPRKNGVLGSPFTVTFPLAGDMIQYQSTDAAASTQDLTGTFIESIASGSSGCLPIAVFSGSSALAMGRQTPNCNGGSYDPLFQQLYPVSTWGKNFGLIPFANYPSGIPYRVMASEDNTILSVNGAVVATLNAGQIYPATFTSTPITVTTPTSITADKPICVTEYEQSSGCAGNTAPGNNQGDPDMVILNPLEQSISDITIFSTRQEVIRSQWVNILIKTGGIPSFRISRNGGTLAAPTGTWQTFGASLPGYSYLKQQLPVPGTGPNPISDSYRLVSDSGFNAIAYGQGDNESYAYSAGTNVIDLNQGVSAQSQYGIINNGQGYSCFNTPFRFNIYLPDSVLSNTGPFAGTKIPIRYDSIKWDVTTNPTAFVPNNFPRMVRPIDQIPPGQAELPYYTNPVIRPDSLRLVNGKPVAWYSLPLPNVYSILATGIYNIKITAYRTNNNGDGCASGNETEFNLTLNVSGPPPATFNYNQPGCPADSVRFVETTPQGPISSGVYPTYRFWWGFGDPASGASNNTSNVRNPVHRFSGPGTYRVRFANITTPGCLSDTSWQDVIVPTLVNATIAGTTTVCQNSTPLPNITFNITPGLAPYRIKYTLSTNGGAPVPQPDIITSTLVNTISAPTGVAGTFAYTITSIQNDNAAYCTVAIIGQTATVTVNPLPTATASGTINVCQNTPPTQTVTFTGTNGATPTTIYEFTYIPTINGVAGAAQTINSNAAGIATISVSTSTAGTYKYDLVSVKDNGTSCSNTLTAGATTTATVFVQANPTATIVTNNAEVCKDGTAPIITFTGSGANGQAPYTFNYTLTLDGTAIATTPLVTSNTSNSATLTVPMTSSGTLIYTITSVTNSGATNCTTNLTGVSVTVKINPLPIGTISGTTTVCQVDGPQSITLSGSAGTRPYTFTYSINGVTQPTVQSSAGVDTRVLSVSTAINTYIYKLIKIEDATNTVCTQNYVAPNEPTATVRVQATSTATITPTTTTVCQDATAPVITFTAANGTPKFDFTYTLTTNGVVGPIQTISTASTAGSFSVPLTVPMGAPGSSSTLVYTLLSVNNTGPTTCVTNITGQTATVNINPIPTATINVAGTNAITVCQNTGTQAINFTGFNATGGAGAVYIFNYSLSTNGGTPVAQPAITGNNLVINQASTTFGVYTYVITSVKDNFTGCTKTYTTNPPTAVVTVKQLATATAAISVPTVCQNSTTLPVITFTASGGVAPYRFKYTLTTNGVTGAVQTTPFTPFGNSLTLNVPTTTAGTYIYTLVSVEESSAGNCVNAQTGSAQVIVHPQPTASYAISSPYCAQQAITFTPSQNITPTGSVVSWVWNYGNGTGTQIRTDGNPFTITYPTAGIKPVSFKVVSDNGCESLLATTPAVVINSKPKAGFINPEACLADAFAQFTDTSSVVGGSIVYWEWDFGDATPIYAGATLAHKNPLHAFATVGNKTVKLTVTTNSGCKSDTTQQFFINGEVTSADFIPQNGGMFCSNRPVQIKENSVVNVGGLIKVDIYWDNVGAPTTVEIDDLPTPGKIYTHSYPNLQIDKTYKVRYIAYSGFNGVCQKETTKDVIVRAAPIASFAPPLNVCLNGGPIQLTGSEIGGVGGTSTYIGTGVSPTGLFNPLTAGAGSNNNITYTAISPNNCDSALVRPIHVLIPPVANFTTTGNLCVGGPSNANVVTFHQTSTVTPGEGGAIVKWIYDWGDGSPLQTFTSGADVTHVYNTAGSKTATLTVEDAFGCRNFPAKQLPFTVNPLPIPRYDVTGACLPNASILFTNTTINLAANSYQWSFELPSTSVANTSTATTNTVNHTYTTQGPFNTHLIATNIATGCKDSTTIKVVDATYIHPEPIVSFTAIPDRCLYNGNYQLIQGSEASGIVGVYSGGPWVSLSGVFNPLLAGVGTHTITYTCTSSFNCPSSKQQTVTVLAPPIIDTFKILGNKCERNDIVFHNAVTQGAGTINTWMYNWGDGITEIVGNGNDRTHQYAIEGTYIATLSLVTDNGCISNPPKPVNVVVNPLPKPYFTYSDTACLPQANVLFKNTTPNINDWAYKWYFDVPPVNALDSSTQRTNINHVYYTQAPHKAKLYALSPTTFCTDSITRDILTIHPAPYANFDFNKLSACIGEDVKVLDNSSFADGTSKSWDWNWGDGSSSIGQNPSRHIYGSPLDNYTVTLKVINSFGCVDDTSRFFAVYELPTANAGRDSIILQGGDITLTPIVTGRQLTYLWSGTPAPENLSSKIVRNPIASPVEDITYTLLVKGIGGCNAPLDYVFIKVLKAPVIPNTFTPNNDGVHDTWVIKYLESYPDNRVQVFTRAGQLVFESKRYVKPWDGTVNGKSLPFDTYYYIIEPGTGRTPITGYVMIVK